MATAVFLLLLLISASDRAGDAGAEKVLRQGEERLEEKDFRAAQAAFLAAMKADPRLERAYTGCAEARRGLGDGEGALQILKQGIERLPRSAALRLALAEAYEGLDRLDSAAAEYERLLAEDPGAAGALAALGLLRLRQGRLDEASAALEKAVGAEPRAAAWHHLALVRSRQGKLEEAIAAYRRAAAIDPSQAKVRYGLGGCLEKLGRLEEAREELERAVALDPDLEPAFYRLGSLCLRLGRAEEGQKNLRRYRELKAAAHFREGESYLSKNDIQRALREYERALDAHPALIDAHARLGRLYVQAGRPGEALAHARRAAELEPKAFRYANVAWVSWQTGALEEARRWIDRALALDPERQEFLSLRAEIEEARRQQDGGGGKKP